MIDWERVAELRDEVGEDSFSEVVTLFLEETDVAISKLSQTLDDTEIKELLHFMKGSALNLGFSKLSQMCRSTSDDPPDLHRLTEIYRASKAELLHASAGKLAS